MKGSTCYVCWVGSGSSLIQITAVTAGPLAEVPGRFINKGSDVCYSKCAATEHSMMRKIGRPSMQLHDHVTFRLTRRMKDNRRPSPFVNLQAVEDILCTLD